MRETLFQVFLSLIAVTFLGCNNSKLSTHNSSILDPDGNFTLYVSNQSFAISPVDIRIQIDGELIVDDEFDVKRQHSFVPFKLSLDKGKHHIKVWSVQGSAQIEEDFELTDQDIAVVTYWYHDTSPDNSTERQFRLETKKGPLLIM